jgi:hypothetical protein
MPILYRLMDLQGRVLCEADSIGYLKGLIADFAPGHYVIDEIPTGVNQSAHTKRRWGVIFKLEDGTILSEPEPE